MQIKRFNSKDEAAAAAGEYLNQLLVENKNRAVLFLPSAGSSLSLLDYVGSAALGENLTISVLDERFSQDPKINNFHQLQKLDFYALALESGASFFGTLPRPDDTIESFAQRWEKNLRTWKTENPDGIIIATLGMGADGHTAGMFSYDEKEFNRLFNGKNWLATHDAKGKHQYSERITTTLTFFKNIDIALGFVCGAEKKQALERLEKNQDKAYQFPAISWHETKNLQVFTDIAIF